MALIVVVITLGAVTAASVIALAWRAGRREWRGYPPQPAIGAPREVHHHWHLNVGAGADPAVAAEIIRRQQARGITEGKD